MAVETYITGSEIFRSIKKKAPDLTYRNLDDMLEIILIFSNGFNIDSKSVKFSKTDKTSLGYTQLIRVSSTEYLASLNSEQTEYLGAGNIYASVDFISTSAGTSDGRQNKKADKLAFILKQSPISSER